jgi:hypothetical protein
MPVKRIYASGRASCAWMSCRQPCEIDRRKACSSHSSSQKRDSKPDSKAEMQFGGRLCRQNSFSRKGHWRRWLWSRSTNAEASVDDPIDRCIPGARPPRRTPRRPPQLRSGFASTAKQQYERDGRSRQRGRYRDRPKHIRGDGTVRTVQSKVARRCSATNGSDNCPARAVG